MGILDIIILSFSLAMDAFAVSICKGLSIKKIKIKQVLTIGLYFGLFQGFMPLIGYLLGSKFSNLVSNIDHFIAFILLGILGLNMIKESFDEEEENDDIGFKTMIVLAVATSIDALAVGVTFAFLNVKLLFAISMIGIITFLLSCIGVIIGNKFENKLGSKAMFTGGLILILIGTKILLDHLGIL